MASSDFIPQDKKCLICGSDKLHFFKAKASDAASPSLINVIECNDCIFAWQYPFSHNEQQSVQHFETAYADKGQTVSEYFSPSYKRKIAELEYEFLSELPIPRGSLLDIGAGSGVFSLVAAENNWHVTALDPALEINNLQKHPMIIPIRGNTDKIPNDTNFDVITMWDVIEHMTEPFEQILTAKHLLKKGGWLIIETGNYKSASRAEGGVNHWMYQLDHKWYFSPDSIKKILLKAGFTDFIISSKVLRPNVNNTIDYAGPSRIQLIQKIIKSPFKSAQLIRKHLKLAEAAKWKNSGIGIFAIAAKKPFS